jgi:hypothetical protein
MAGGKADEAPAPLDRLLIERTENGYLVTEARPFHECKGRRWVAADARILAALVQCLVAPGEVVPVAAPGCVEPTFRENFRAGRFGP